MRQRVALVGQQLHRLAQHARSRRRSPRSSSERTGRSSAAGGICPMVHSRTVRMRLDYGSDGLDVDLPDSRRDGDRAGVPAGSARRARRAADGHAATRSTARRCAALVKPGQRVAISVCDITRAQPRREMLRAIFEELPHMPRSRRHDPHCHRHPPRRTPRPSSSGCWAATSWTRCRVINHDSRDAGVARARRTHVHRRGRVPQPRVAGGRRPHHHRVRGAAFLRRLQRRAEDGGARPGRARARC